MRAFGRTLQRISVAEQTIQRLGGRIEPSAIHGQLRQLASHGTQPENQGGVTVLPAHDTRGREWPVVFLPRLNEHIFPADAHISALFRESTAHGLKAQAEQLAERRGLGSGAFSFVGFAESPRDSKEEEDRLFNLAATRATEQLILSWSERDADKEISPSIYVRRAVARHSGQSVQEIDWAESIAQFRHDVPAKAYWYPPTRERLSFPDVSGETVFQSVALKHSPSSLSVRWLCPRKYFYERILGLERAVGDPQVYGMLVHRILQTLILHPPETVRLESILNRPDIQDIVEKYHHRFSSETVFSFSMGRLRSALQDFLDNNDAFFQQRLFVYDGNPVVEKELEQTTNLENRTVNLVGKIDVALHDPSGQVRIIDFKTGQSATVDALRRSMVYRDDEDAAINPVDRDYQLPFYRLLLVPEGEVLLSHFYLQPVYGGRKGFKEVTIRITDEFSGGKGEITGAELDAGLNEALRLAIDIEQAVEFPREPKNQACRHGMSECSFLFLCDRMGG
ncbi:MAG: PD-(D/E)XK nuclease family protein [bacterium]